jgi:extracellular factor (EF) 3-hydroxypalmitic acid methyl ester biosynthesis protein
MLDSVSDCSLSNFEQSTSPLERAQAINWELHRALVQLQQRFVLEPDFAIDPAFRSATIASLLGFYRELSALHERLSSAERERVMLQHRMLVQPAFLSVPLIRRSLDRPLGYPGDYVMVEMIFGNSPLASSPFAAMLEELVLAAAPSQAHRHRVPWADGQLQTFARELGRVPQVLSFACGPEIVLREHVKLGGTADIVLCDHEPLALEHARAGLTPWLAERGSVRSVQLSVVNLLRGAGQRELVGGVEPGFDAVLVLGLFDYLRAGIVKRLMRAFHSLLRPGGLLLSSNLASGNPHRSLMEYVADWHVIHRSHADFEDLMVSETGFTGLELITDPSGANLFFAARA